MKGSYPKCPNCGNVADGAPLYRCIRQEKGTTCLQLFCDACSGEPDNVIAMAGGALGVLAQIAGAEDVPRPFCPQCGSLGRHVASISPRLLDRL